jgi:hypothetical protein
VLKNRAKTWHMINHYQLLCQQRSMIYGREIKLKQGSQNQYEKDSNVSPVHAIKPSNAQLNPFCHLLAL